MYSLLTFHSNISSLIAYRILLTADKPWLIKIQSENSVKIYSVIVLFFVHVYANLKMFLQKFKIFLHREVGNVYFLFFYVLMMLKK